MCRREELCGKLYSSIKKNLQEMKKIKNKYDLFLAFKVANLVQKNCLKCVHYLMQASVIKRQTLECICIK